MKRTQRRHPEYRVTPNLYGQRRRYCPNRAKNPDRRRVEPKLTLIRGPLQGSGRGCTTAQARARLARKQREQIRTTARYRGGLPRLNDVRDRVSVWLRNFKG